MKKTLITAAVALGLLSTAFADIVYTGTTYTTQTANPTANNHLFGNCASFTFTLSDSYIGKDSTSGVWTTASTSGVTSFYEGEANALALTTITLWNSGNQNYPPAALVILDGDTVVATAVSVKQTQDDIVLVSGGSKRDQWEWTFTPESSLLYTGKTYTVKFANANTGSLVATSYTYPEDFDYSNYSTWGLTVNNASDKIGTASDNSGYQAAGMLLVTQAVKVVADTDAVPEPATATLSLLALAGLAARRRRK